MDFPMVQTKIDFELSPAETSSIDDQKRFLEKIGSLVIVLAVSYSVIAILLGGTFLQDWSNEFMATGLSAALAAIVGLFLFNVREGHKAEERHAKLRALLAAEVRSALRVLAEGEPLLVEAGGEIREVVLAGVQPIALREALRSGLFSDEAASALVGVLRRIQVYDASRALVIELIGADSETPTPSLETAVEIHAEAHDDLVGDFQNLLTSLDGDETARSSS